MYIKTPLWNVWFWQLKKNYCQNVDLEDCVVYLTVKQNSIVENSIVFGNWFQCGVLFMWWTSKTK